MNLNKIKSVIALLAILLLASCDRPFNVWNPDPSKDGLFSSLNFEVGNIKPTSAQVAFNRVADASTYEFEFSLDPAFATIDRSVTLLQDTLTPFSNSNVITRVQYRITFDKLYGNTTYYLRMKAWDKDRALASSYQQTEFATPAENIFNPSVAVTTSSATLTWMPGAEVTTLKLMRSADLVEELFTLTPEEIEQGSKQFDNLSMGTNYTAGIFNGERPRGSINFTTSGAAGSKVINLKAEDAAFLKDSIVYYMAQESILSFTVIFNNGATYDMESNFTVPAGVNTLILTSASSQGERPTLNINKITLASLLEELSLENIACISPLGSSSGSAELFNGNGNGSIYAQKYRINGCLIQGYRCVARMQNAVEITDLTISNSLINDIGSYHIINIGSKNAVIGKVNIESSTLTRINGRWIDIRAQAEQIKLSACTFYNPTSTATENYPTVSNIIRLNGNNPTDIPGSLITEGLILSGGNGGVEVKVGYGTYSLMSYDFQSSYRTNDFKVSTANNNSFLNIQVFTQSTEELFVDPSAGDFHLKPGTIPTGTYGDPRWF